MDLDCFCFLWSPGINLDSIVSFGPTKPNNKERGGSAFLFGPSIVVSYLLYC